jgi:hypothetical protein
MFQIPFLIVTSEADYFHTVSSQLPRAYACVRVDIHSYLERVQRGEFVVAVIDEVAITPEVTRLIRRAMQRGLPLPCVLRRRANAVTPLNVGLTAVRLPELAEHAPSPFTRAVLESFRRAVLTAMRDDIRIGDNILELVEVILFTDPPVRSSRDLARRLGKGRDAVNATWKQAQGDAVGPALWEFIEQWLVVSAAEKRRARVGLRTTLSQAVHIRESRLFTASERWFAMPFSEICGARIYVPLALMARTTLASIGLDAARLFAR